MQSTHDPEPALKGERAALAREVLELIGQHLVSEDGDFRVETEVEGTSATVFALHCHASDRGQLIGRKGRMFRALMDIVAAIGSPKGEQLSISEVVRPERPALPRLGSRIPFNPDWPKGSIRFLAGIVAEAVFGNCTVTLVPMPRGAVLDVFVPRSIQRESAHDDLKAAIRTVFAAIGTNHGCSLIIDFRFK